MSATFVTFVYLNECSPTVVHSSDLLGYISSMVPCDETSTESLIACIAVKLVEQDGAALAMTKSVYRVATGKNELLWYYRVSAIRIGKK